MSGEVAEGLARMDAEMLARRARRQRQDRHSVEIVERLEAASGRLPVEALRELVVMLSSELGYLGDHYPEERSTATVFPCSEEAYHLCSFSGRHHPDCRAVGGDGVLPANMHGSRSCGPLCDAEGVERPWCFSSGFDCSTCELVDRLLVMLDTHGA